MQYIFFSYDGGKTTGPGAATDAGEPVFDTTGAPFVTVATAG